MAKLLPLLNYANYLINKYFKSVVNILKDVYNRRQWKMLKNNIRTNLDLEVTLGYSFSNKNQIKTRMLAEDGAEALKGGNMR